jgi:hypothetical protein
MDRFGMGGSISGIPDSSEIQVTIERVCDPLFFLCNPQADPKSGSIDSLFGINQKHLRIKLLAAG